MVLAQVLRRRRRRRRRLRRRRRTGRQTAKPSRLARAMPLLHHKVMPAEVRKPVLYYLLRVLSPTGWVEK